MICPFYLDMMSKIINWYLRYGNSFEYLHFKINNKLIANRK